MSDNLESDMIDIGDAYASLIGLSILSALVILSLWLFMLTIKEPPASSNLNDGYDLSNCYYAINVLRMRALILIAQWVLVVPATWVVVRLSQRKQVYKIPSGVCFVMLLTFNILAAMSMFIITLPHIICFF